jgi:hypothetical protein
MAQTDMRQFQNPQDKMAGEKPREIQQKAKTLTDDVGELLDLYHKLAIVTLTQKAASAASVGITVMVILFLVMFIFLFAGFGFAWYLGEALRSMVAGYSIVAGIFILIMGLILALRKKLLFPYIRNNIIKKIYE